MTPATKHHTPPLVIINHEHVGRVLAERLRVGPGYLYDVRQKFKARQAIDSQCVAARGC